MRSLFYHLILYYLILSCRRLHCTTTGGGGNSVSKLILSYATHLIFCHLTLSYYSLSMSHDGDGGTSNTGPYRASSCLSASKASHLASGETGCHRDASRRAGDAETLAMTAYGITMSRQRICRHFLIVVSFFFALKSRTECCQFIIITSLSL